MGKISESSIFYKPYLYYNLYIRYKALRKRNTYSQNQEDLFIDFQNIDQVVVLEVWGYI